MKFDPPPPSLLELRNKLRLAKHKIQVAKTAVIKAETALDKLQNVKCREELEGYDYLDKHLSKNWVRDFGIFFYRPDDEETSIDFTVRSGTWNYVKDQIFVNHRGTPAETVQFLRKINSL